MNKITLTDFEKSGDCVNQECNKTTAKIHFALAERLAEQCIAQKLQEAGKEHNKNLWDEIHELNAKIKELKQENEIFRENLKEATELLIASQHRDKLKDKQIESLKSDLEFCYNKTYILYHSSKSKVPTQSVQSDLDKLWDKVSKYSASKTT